MIESSVRADNGEVSVNLQFLGHFRADFGVCYFGDVVQQRCLVHDYMRGHKRGRAQRFQLVAERPELAPVAATAHTATGPITALPIPILAPVAATARISALL